MDLEHANNTELLAALAGKPVAETLLQQYGGLTSIAQASFDELRTIKGIGQSKAAAIKSAFLLAQRLSKESYVEAPLFEHIFRRGHGASSRAFLSVCSGRNNCKKLSGKGMKPNRS